MTNTTQLDWQNYSVSEDKFDNKVVLVTGSAGGIGRAVTRALASHGATVIMLDRKLRHLEKLYDEIISAGDTEPVILPQDLARMDGEVLGKITDGIDNDFGVLHAILHNAAELGSPGPLSQYRGDAWTRVMLTNMQAPWLLTQSLLPLLEKADRASVVFSSAQCGRKPAANWGAYSIAYAAVEAQMRIWAQETKNISAVRFNSLDPGPVNTPMRRVSHPGESPSASVAPDEIVRAYLYLLGDDSVTVNGQSLNLQAP